MKMDYCVLGTNQMEAASEFYNSFFEGTALKATFQTERMHFWQSDDLAFAIALPFDEQPATNGNGTMIGLDVGSMDEVNRLHAKAIELGGTSEGAPNQRGPYYSGYVRDLDKNKICLYHVV